jgi:nucleoside-diphosphate-sugar epimerase
MHIALPNNRLSRDLDDIVDRTETLWDELRGQRILITGATGFFGCWLLESFAWANRRLDLKASAIAMSRNPQALAQKTPHLATNSAITLHAGDVRFDNFPQGSFSHVIHAATEASATMNRHAPAMMFDTITTGTRRALDFAAAESVKKFLFLSSGAAYGTQPPEVRFVSESFLGGPDPLDPANAYAEGKRSAELLCALTGQASPGMEIKIARCFAFVGPYMQLDAHFAIGNFISDCMDPRPISIQGDGTAVRSYLYASDLTVWLWTILFKGQPCRAYNVGSEEALNISSLAREVADTLSSKHEIKIANAPRAGVPSHRYVPSTARAREELGLRAEVPLREAIRRTHGWFARKPHNNQPIESHKTARGAHA